MPQIQLSLPISTTTIRIHTTINSLLDYHRSLLAGLSTSTLAPYAAFSTEPG